MPILDYTQDETVHISPNNVLHCRTERHKTTQIMRMTVETATGTTGHPIVVAS